MPNCGSWNGKWSGQDSLYSRVRKFNKKDCDKFKIKEKLNNSFSYRWDDGWCALVEVKSIDSKEANQIRKLTKGFYGYDWMIDSILDFGYITTDIEK